jgi:transposase-like protein
MARRHYSDEERAAALAALKANGGDSKRTAAQVGVPESSLRHWAKLPDRAAPAKLRAENEQDLAAKLMDLAHRLVDAAPKKIAKAGLRDVVVAAAVALDKARLARGLPTAINETRRFDASKLTEDEAITLDRLLARGSVPDADPAPVGG